jgi:hypothetical protein
MPAPRLHGCENGSALGTRTRTAVYRLYPMGRLAGREYRSAITSKNCGPA